MKSDSYVCASCDRTLLKTVTWEEGKVINLAAGTYWYKLVILCSSMGKQKAVFADGKEHPFFEFAHSLRDTAYVTNLVPVLPDGRFLMVLEQRGPHALYPERPRVVERFGDRKNIELGEYGSLEFPGGAVDEGEDFISAALQELEEETGIKNQEVELFLQNAPVFPLGSGVALGTKTGVVYLSAPNHAEFVFEDGVKMNTFALTEKDIDWGIASGAINSGQAAHLGWSFYKTMGKKLQWFAKNVLMEHSELQNVMRTYRDSVTYTKTQLKS